MKNTKSLAVGATILLGLISSQAFASDVSIESLPKGTKISFHVKTILPATDRPISTVTLGSYKSLTCELSIYRPRENRSDALSLDFDVTETMSGANREYEGVFLHGTFTFNGVTQGSDVQYIDCSPTSAEITTPFINDSWSVDSFQQFIDSIGGTLTIPAPVPYGATEQVKLPTPVDLNKKDLSQIPAGTQLSFHVSGSTDNDPRFNLIKARMAKIADAGGLACFLADETSHKQRKIDSDITMTVESASADNWVGYGYQITGKVITKQNNSKDPLQFSSILCVLDPRKQTQNYTTVGDFKELLQGVDGTVTDPANTSSQ